MSSQFTYQRRVEFRDTDMAGIVHFSVFFAYMEEAEHAFLRSLGMSVVSIIDGEKISWPRVAAECNYRRAIRFEQVIDIKLSIARIGEKSIAYRFEFLESGQVVADGKVTAVCCKINHGQPPQSIAIPTAIREKLA